MRLLLNVSNDTALFEEALDGFICLTKSRMTWLSTQKILNHMKKHMTDKIPPEMLEDESRLRIRISCYLRSRGYPPYHTAIQVAEWKQNHGRGVNSFMVDKMGAVVAFTRSG